ncbi:MAG TPA: hypothetical protein VN761_12320 [Candidatus Polarisedimenticolia bacterium]|nr:hypothetical protein [Candidatus Polarisedimenticolia bacterium]
MNDKKINRLFGAARRETPAAPAEGFERLVMQQISRAPARAELSVSDVLNLWFPRLAAAAAAVIILCVVGEYVSPGPSLTDSATQLQLLAEN